MDSSLGILQSAFLCANVGVFDASLEHAADSDVRAPIIALQLL